MQPHDDGLTVGFWRSQEMLLLKNVMTLVGRGLELDVVVREILHLLSELLGLNRGRVVQIGPDGIYSIKYAYGLTRKEIAQGVYEKGEGITGTVLRDHQLIVVQDIDSDPLFLGRAVARSDLPQEKVAFIAIPIHGYQDEIAVIACHRLRHRNRDLVDDINILQIVSNLIGQLLKLKGSVEEQKRELKQENLLLAQALESATLRYGIVGRSPALLQSVTELERLCDSTSPVLLQGRSGTGKDLFARALHLASTRSARPFIKINCGTLQENTCHAELFGYERGSFPGARERHIGLLEQANKGTIFLDRVDEIPLKIQSELLKLLEDKKIKRIGSNYYVDLDIKIISASTENMIDFLKEKKILHEFYYTINGISIEVPSLKKRKEDIPLLAEHFLNNLNQIYDRSVSLSPSAIRFLARQDWNGEIRELRNFIEKTILISRKKLINKEEISLIMREYRNNQLYYQNKDIYNTKIRPYENVSEIQREEIVKALIANKGNKLNSAKMLNISYKQILYRMKKLSIS